MALQDLTPQLRTRLKRIEKIVGIFVTVALLLVVAGFVYFLYHRAETKGWFVPKVKYHTYVQTAQGLNLGDSILLMGFKVGEITTIEAQPPGSYYAVFVGFEIKRPYYGYIWTDSKIRIAPSGLLGSRQLEITKGYDGMPTVEADHKNRPTHVRVGSDMVGIEKAPHGVFMSPDEAPTLTERAEKLVAQAEAALPNLLSVTNRVNAVLDHTAQLTSNAASLTAHADVLVTGAQPIVTNLAAITANLSKPKGSFGEWALPAETQALLNTNLASLNLTLQNVASITSNLHWQVQQNDQMLTEISRLVIETDDLMQGLKRHWLLKGAFEPDKETTEPMMEPLMGGEGEKK